MGFLFLKSSMDLKYATTACSTIPFGGLGIGQAATTGGCESKPAPPEAGTTGVYSSPSCLMARCQREGMGQGQQMPSSMLFLRSSLTVCICTDSCRAALDVFPLLSCLLCHATDRRRCRKLWGGAIARLCNLGGYGGGYCFCWEGSGRRWTRLMNRQGSSNNMHFVHTCKTHQ